jgi:hypothetical protein
MHCGRSGESRRHAINRPGVSLRRCPNKSSRARQDKRPARFCSRAEPRASTRVGQSYQRLTTRAASYATSACSWPSCARSAQPHRSEPCSSPEKATRFFRIVRMPRREPGSWSNRSTALADFARDATRRARWSSATGAARGRPTWNAIRSCIRWTNHHAKRCKRGSVNETCDEVWDSRKHRRDEGHTHQSLKDGLRRDLAVAALGEGKQLVKGCGADPICNRSCGAPST